MSDALPAQFTEAQAAKKLGISKSLLMRERARGRVHPIRYGERVIRYTDEILIEYQKTLPDYCGPQEKLALSVESIIGAAFRSKTSVVREPAIYFLYKNGRVVYVGQTGNFIGRLANHLYHKDFDAYASVPVPRELLDSIERALIDELKPPLNIMLNSENYTSRRTR